MVVNFLERVLILQLLPAENNILDLRIVVDLKRKLAASEEEIKEFNIKGEEGRVSWDKDFETEIEVGDRAKEIIKGALMKLDEDSKLTDQYLTLVDKFIDVKEDLP